MRSPSMHTQVPSSVTRCLSSRYFWACFGSSLMMLKWSSIAVGSSFHAPYMWPRPKQGLYPGWGIEIRLESASDGAGLSVVLPPPRPTSFHVPMAASRPKSGLRVDKGRATLMHLDDLAPLEALAGPL